MAKKYTLLKGVPSSVQAIILATITTLGLLVLSPIIGVILPFETDLGETFAYLLYSIIISVGCFYISRQNPASFWYVPIIANCFVLFAAAIEPTFWKSSMWIFWGSSVPLSIITSILGAKK